MRNVIITGVNLEPGAHVLLAVPEYNEVELFELKRFLEQEFYGVKFTLISGCELIGSFQNDVKVLEG